MEQQQSAVRRSMQLRKQKLIDQLEQTQFPIEPKEAAKILEQTSEEQSNNKVLKQVLNIQQNIHRHEQQVTRCMHRAELNWRAKQQTRDQQMKKINKNLKAARRDESLAKNGISASFVRKEKTL